MKALTHLGWVAGAAAAGIACRLAADHGLGATPIDRALPLIGVVIVLLAWLVRETRASAGIQLAVPLLVAIEATIGDERLRLLSIGLVVALAFAATIGTSLRGGVVPPVIALTIVVAATALLRWLPLADVELLREIAAIVGIMLLALAIIECNKRRGLTPLGMAIVIAIALVTPVHPGRAIAYPFALASIAMLWRKDDNRPERRAGPFGLLLREPLSLSALALSLGLAGGPWLFAITAIAVAVHWIGPAIRRRVERASPAISLPLRRASSFVMLARSALFAPWLAADLARADATAACVALILITGAFARSPVAPLYVLAATVVALARGTSRGAEPGVARVRSYAVATLSAPSIVIAVLFIAMFPWSGAVARAFPLPLTLAALIALMLLASAGRLAPAIGAVGALAFLFNANLILPDTAPIEGTRQLLGWALSSSQTIDVPLPPHTRTATLVVSGANFSPLPPGTPVGTVEMIDRHGRCTSRQLTIGDVVDWGFMRREHAFLSRNSLPRRPVWQFNGYGASAWLGGQSLVTLRGLDDLASLRVAAAPSLPPPSRLQIDSVIAHER
ncbi:MAG TPA: hypothetical protein VEZ11_08460 [Thermoanaerobaculia bacterium]|nr:hypothetical protein [Thermoanaerobaculia bacterium]